MKDLILVCYHQAEQLLSYIVFVPDLPDPEEHGWKEDANGILSIHWCSDLVPQLFADILLENQTTLQQESNNDDDIQSDVDSDADSQDDSD